MRRSPTLAAVAAAVLLSALSGVGAPQARAADSCGADSATLLDGGFETPLVDPGTFVQLDSSLVPPWLTTDSLNEIEIWGLGFNGVPAAEGNQFAELNANSPGTLYQDVVTTTGEIMTWTIQHRGREGDDTMQVLIGDATTADVTSDVGWNYFSADLTDGNAAWGTHSATYVVPVGQTCTRFGFRAVSAAGGNPSIGNFLDATAFSVAVPATPSPPPSSPPTAKPTPPVTASVAADPAIGNGPSDLVILAMAAIGLAVGGLAQVRRRATRSGR
jgi:hypothetical protein